MAGEIENQSEKIPATGVLKKFFHHPNFNAVAGLFGIVGTFLAIYFYKESIKEPNLTYYISPTRTPIVQNGNLDNFSVIFQGTPIKGDLSAAEIQIWNQGKQPIRREDIRKPITITTPNHERIYQVAKVTTRDVVKVEAYGWATNSDQQQGVVMLDWNILEKNDGVKIQIIYGGNVNLPLIVDGVIVGQQGLTKFKQETSFFNSYRPFIVSLAFSLCILWGWYSVDMAVFISKQLRAKRWSGYYFLISFSTMAIGMVILVYLANYLLTPIKPPFGF
jgi:hypothetical protein